MASSNNSKSEKKTKNRETSKTEGKRKKDGVSEKEKERKKNKKLKLSNGNSKQKQQQEEKAVGGEESKMHVFPINRIRTIIKAEDPDLRVSQEAILVINKATEKFLEQFTKDAYTSAVQDRKKSLSYNHLAHVVSKQRRYDFLCDFVPEKVKAEDALRERNSGGKEGG